jgi:hypothetical protein
MGDPPEPTAADSVKPTPQRTQGRIAVLLVLGDGHPDGREPRVPEEGLPPPDEETRVTGLPGLVSHGRSCRCPNATPPEGLDDAT